MDIQTTNITLSFPNWFYGVLTLSATGVLVYIGSLHYQLKRICEDHPKIRQALTRISEILLQKEFAKDLVYTQSPVQLSPAGQKILDDSGFEKFYNANKQTIKERILKSNPKNLADLEEACKDLMLSIEDTLPCFELLKNYAYSQGEPISKILFAASIGLRDKLKTELNIQA